MLIPVKSGDSGDGSRTGLPLSSGGISGGNCRGELEEVRFDCSTEVFGIEIDIGFLREDDDAGCVVMVTSGDGVKITGVL